MMLSCPVPPAYIMRPSGTSCLTYTDCPPLALKLVHCLKGVYIDELIRCSLSNVLQLELELELCQTVKVGYL